MKYDHIVKTNGKYYAAGEEVPSMAAEETPLPFSDKDIMFEENQDGKKYTKTDIMRMNKSELQEIVKNAGIEGTEGMNGAELKEHLISIFGL